MLPRTYSRRQRRQSKASEALSDTSSDRSLSPSRRKRRKVEVETAHTSPHAPEDLDKETLAAEVFHRLVPSKSEGIRNGRATSPTSLRSARQTATRAATSRTQSVHGAQSRTRSIPHNIASSSSHTPRATSVLAAPPLSSDKTVKNLSDLFDFHERQDTIEKPVSKGGGVARRMLRRTKTDPSVDVSSTPEVQAGPSTRRKLSREKTEIIRIAPGSLPSTPTKPGSFEDPAMVRPLLAGASSNVRTYGGKSRSFLVALGTNGNPAEDDEPLEDDPEDDFTIRESYNELRERWGVDNSDHDPYPEPSISPGRRKGKGRQAETPVVHLPNGMMNDLKSITELRSKGESRRFLDDVGYLFEGLESTAALSVRRGSAMEIVSKLCDVEFARKAKATDFLGRTWDSLREGGGGKGDKVLDTILVFFISLVARDPRDLPEVMLKPDFNSVLFGLLASLDKINDPLWLLSCGLSDVELRHAGMAKTDKTLLHGIHTLIRKKSELFGEESAISNRLLIGYTLSALPPHLHSSSDVHILLNDFLSETEHISSRITSYASGLPLIPPLQSSSRMLAFSFLHIDQCLRLLDSYLLRQWSQSDDPSTDDIRSMENADTRQVLSRLIAICAATAMALHEDSLFALRDTAHRCMESSFRVLINLTHDNVDICQTIAEDPLTLLTLIRIVVTSHRERMAFNVQQESASDPGETDTAAQLVDRLCLALGVLTNLVQNDRMVHLSLQELKVDLRCRGQRRCSTACRCQSPVSGLDCLASVYLEFCKLDAELDVVVRGHIAILFGLLMRGNTDVQRMLLEKLPGTTNKKKLAGLVDNAREFALFYVEFAKKASAATEGRNEEEGSREGPVAGDVDMRQVLRDTQGESVARDVLSFLTSLRDQTRS